MLEYALFLILFEELQTVLMLATRIFTFQLNQTRLITKGTPRTIRPSNWRPLRALNFSVSRLNDTKSASRVLIKSSSLFNNAIGVTLIPLSREGTTYFRVQQERSLALKEDSFKTHI